jgi:uncharacterized membrane protein YuzA (DUF378 family)
MEEARDPRPGTSEKMPLPARLAGVITGPVAVFDEVAATPRTPSNWITPWILLVVATGILTQLLIGNPDFAAQLTALMRDQVDLLVNDGTVQREDADRQLALLEPGMPLFTVLSIAGPAAWGLGLVFALALLYWLIGRSAMQASAPYMKVVEVVGLASVISVIELCVTTGLILATGTLTVTPTAAALFPTLAHDTALYALLLKANPFSLWLVIVTSIGLARLFGRDIPKVVVLITSLWVLWTAAVLIT